MRREVGLHALERERSRALQDALAALVAGQGMAGEIVLAGITHVLPDRWIDAA